MVNNFTRRRELPGFRSPPATLSHFLPGFPGTLSQFLGVFDGGWPVGVCRVLVRVGEGPRERYGYWERVR